MDYYHKIELYICNNHTHLSSECSVSGRKVVMVVAAAMTAEIVERGGRETVMLISGGGRGREAVM